MLVGSRHRLQRVGTGCILQFRTQGTFVSMCLDPAVPAAGRRLSLPCDPHGSPCRSDAEGRMQLDAHVLGSALPCPAVTRATKRQSSFVAKCGREYVKHAAFRRDNGLLDADGGWLRSKLLDDAFVPSMAARALDVLHILWLLFERRGVDPRQVRQAWLICQSICRSSGPYERGCFSGVRPDIPGLSFQFQQCTIVPCVLPRGHLWLNTHRRFASGAEAFQFQGIHVRSEFPAWANAENSLLKQIAGDGFAIPTVGLFVLVALASVIAGMPPPCMPAATTGLVDKVQLVDFSFVTLAGLYVRRLVRLWPDFLRTVRSAVTVKLGTLCSGADFIVLFAHRLVEEMNRQGNTAEVRLVNVFGCEKNSRVRRLREQVSVAMGPCYPDVHTLPLDQMSAVDILVFGSSCKGLSAQNNNKRSLLQCNELDPLCSSGATMQSCLKYVAAHMPKIVILENVVGLEHVADQSGARNIDIVYARLHALGYSCCHVRRNARDLLPQSRTRVYLVATLIKVGPADSGGIQAWTNFIQQCQPDVSIPFEACLLE